MYTVRVTSKFSSAHKLRGYRGKCEDLHGHNWRVEVAADAEVLDETGMVVDFKAMKEALGRIMSELDHKYLNELDHFRKFNPTSENIARYIYEEMSGKNAGINMREVTVWETDSSSASYSGD
ncbi:MAG: 6-carboxytetrahydropterin synthase QueD [Candidatus Omnitrophota bacterium]